nr:MAG TPA_asm: hypothetical protein [Caudoviricetes sp.]
MTTAVGNGIAAIAMQRSGHRPVITPVQLNAPSAA